MQTRSPWCLDALAVLGLLACTPAKKVTLPTDSGALIVPDRMASARGWEFHKSELTPDPAETLRLPQSWRQRFPVLGSLVASRRIVKLSKSCFSAETSPRLGERFELMVHSTDRWADFEAAKAMFKAHGLDVQVDDENDAIFRAFGPQFFIFVNAADPLFPVLIQAESRCPSVEVDAYFAIPPLSSFAPLRALGAGIDKLTYVRYERVAPSAFLDLSVSAAKRADVERWLANAGTRNGDEWKLDGGIGESVRIEGRDSVSVRIRTAPWLPAWHP